MRMGKTVGEINWMQKKDTIENALSIGMNEYWGLIWRKNNEETWWITIEVLENEKYVVTDDDGKILIFDGEKGEAYPTHKSFSKYYLERFEEEQKRMEK
jgi:hypothetical protein